MATEVVRALAMDMGTHRTLEAKVAIAFAKALAFAILRACLRYGDIAVSHWVIEVSWDHATHERIVLFVCGTCSGSGSRNGCGGRPGRSGSRSRG